MEITLQFTTKERYKKAVHYMMHDCTRYNLKRNGKYLYGPIYGYITIEKNYDFLVICDTCGKEFDLSDPENCDVYPCDCGKAFCADCFIKRFGKADFDSMIDAWESYCPDCWPKYRTEILNR